MFIENKDGNIILKIKIVPNSPENCIKGVVGDMLRVKINAVPENNKANHELTCYLAKFFDIKRSNIKIIKGLKSRDKIITIKGANYNKILGKLKEVVM